MFEVVNNVIGFAIGALVTVSLVGSMLVVIALAYSGIRAILTGKRDE